MHGSVRPPVASAEFCMSSFLVLLVISTAEDSRCWIMLRHSRSQPTTLPIDRIPPFWDSARICSREISAPGNPCGASFRTHMRGTTVTGPPRCREYHCAHSGCTGRSPFISDVGKARFFARSASKPPACLWRVLRKLNECDLCPRSSFHCLILPPFTFRLQCTFSNAGKTLQYLY